MHDSTVSKIMKMLSIHSSTSPTSITNSPITFLDRGVEESHNAFSEKFMPVI